MKLFDVYPLFDIEIEKGQGCYIWDVDGKKYLDLYGGHAVISIGHSHVHYVDKITQQINKIGFYSNSVQIPQQKELAKKLGELSGKDNYELFLCNSGAEANENALKLASFHTGNKKIISFSNGFHGRTSLAVALTDNSKIVAPVNETDNTLILPFNDVEALENAFTEHEIACVIVEPIQGVGGVHEISQLFANSIRELCDQYNAVFIADEVQCGYGRSGKFFALDHLAVDADVYTVAKGMGNGFPIGGVLISPKLESSYGLLGTTFGGNHLACAAGIGVLEVMKIEKLLKNTTQMGDYLIKGLEGIKGIKEVRGKGLMVGIELDIEAGPVRKAILNEFKIFTGSSSNSKTIRVLPALNVTETELDKFVLALKDILKRY